MSVSPLSEEEIKALRLLASRHVTFLDGKLRWFYLNKCMICYLNLSNFQHNYTQYLIEIDDVINHAREHLKEHKLIAFI